MADDHVRQMTTYVLRRLGHAAITLAIVTVVTFLLVGLAPGGFVMESASGMSAERLPNTVLLAGVALTLSTVGGVLLGALCAVRAYSWFDNAVSAITFVGLAVPIFWLGILLIMLFSVRLGWLPSSGLTSIGQEDSIADRVKHLILPALMLAVASATFLVLLWGLVLGAPAVLPYAPNTVNLMEALDPPSLAHPLGTDPNGRDILARLLHGGRVSLAVGVLAMLLSVALGTLVGALSGFYGGAVGAVLMRFTEAMLSLPTFFLVVAILGFLPGGGAVALVIGITSWVSIARVVRGEFLRWKSAEFVDAARVIGAGNARIIVRHILPQALPTIVVASTLGIAFAILTESAISYLGLGIQPPTPTWGNMLLEGQQYVFDRPLLAVYPGLMILFTVVCFNGIGDGLRDALDPWMSDR